MNENVKMLISICFMHHKSFKDLREIVLYIVVKYITPLAVLLAKLYLVQKACVKTS